MLHYEGESGKMMWAGHVATVDINMQLLYSNNPRLEKHLGDICMDGKILLKCVLHKVL
jgi:hypothetical protein